MEKKKSTQQTDGHSCGVHTIMHANKLAGNMVKGIDLVQEGFSLLLVS